MESDYQENRVQDIRESEHQIRIFTLEAYLSDILLS
jgi:hypothetical protein